MANEMTKEDFCATAAKLMGRGWQTRLANALGVNPRTVNRWANGEISVPPWVRVALRGIDANAEK